MSERLRSAGWVVLARQLRVGRDEVDILALDPGPPRTVVVVEVRSRTSPGFGQPEERLDEAKVRRLYRAMHALRAAWPPSEGMPIGSDLGWRVDLVVLDAWTGQLRYLRGVIPR